VSKKRIVVLGLCLALILVIFAAATGGSEGDSLVSLSFVTEFFNNNIFSKVTETSNNVSNNAAANVDAALNAYKESAYGRMDGILLASVTDRVIKKIKANPELIVELRTEEVKLYKGDKIVGRPGSGVILKEGTGKIYGPANAEVLNVTTGTTRLPGFTIKEGIYYMMLNNDKSGIIITSDTATALIKDGAYIIPSYEVKYEKYADILYDLGLFKGSDNGYELSRAATRHEAVIMLIRLLGEEKEALAFDSSDMPFTDVVGWEDGKKYIAYAAHRNYVNGVGDGRFDQYGVASAHMYITLVLRAMGYTDSGDNPDFIWNSTSIDLAVELGFITEEQSQDMLKEGLRRDHVVLISLNAVFKQIKGKDYTLAQKLMDKGVVTQEQINSAITQLLQE